MSKKSECEVAATALIAARREAAQADAFSRESRIFAECPRAAILTEEMQKNMSRLFATFNDKSKDDALFADCKKRATELRKERTAELAAHGYTEKDLEVRYFCPLCKDTGAVEDKLCTCYKKALAEEYLKASNISEMKDRMSFSKFRLDFYKDDAKERMEQLLKFSKEYVRDFSRRSQNMLFSGNPGSGKTFLSCAIGFELIDNGVFVLYTPVQDMISAFEASQFSHATDVDTDVFTSAELLIIDDLGAEFKTQYAESVLYNVINTRLIRSLPFIISTNLTGAQISERYHERLASRLTYETLLLSFPEQDIRLKKKKK